MGLDFDLKPCLLLGLLEPPEEPESGNPSVTGGLGHGFPGCWDMGCTQNPEHGLRLKVWLHFAFSASDKLEIGMTGVPREISSQVAGTTRAPP